MSAARSRTLPRTSKRNSTAPKFALTAVDGAKRTQFPLILCSRNNIKFYSITAIKKYLRHDTLSVIKYSNCFSQLYEDLEEMCNILVLK
ncbi:hypothetical protein WA026_005604 [Henosepilachna vigintioctopunctata]|uniref:Uncharacterized protein n=1 Tax=Henosepilachna vigintioctopunctata TaxID=420089 RepID=A0AAW1U1G6_9CUCU